MQVPSAGVVKVDDDGWSLFEKLGEQDGAPVVDWWISHGSRPARTIAPAMGTQGPSWQPSFPRAMRHSLSRETAAFFVKHRVSKLVHFKDGEQGVPCGTLSCGRTLNTNYEQVSKFDTFDLCERCRLNAEMAS